MGDDDCSTICTGGEVGGFYAVTAGWAGEGFEYFKTERENFNFNSKFFDGYFNAEHALDHQQS